MVVVAVILMGLGTVALGQYVGAPGDITVDGDPLLGARVFLTGDGFAANAEVELEVRPAGEADALDIREEGDEWTADADGAIRIPLDLVQPFALGTYELEILGSASDSALHKLNGRVIITAAQPSPTPEPTPTPEPETPPTCKGQTATHWGTDAGETINGSAGDDVIVGLGGNDTINGLGGNDLICAGAGNDKVKGGGGADRIYGEGGNDKLRGNGGKDRIWGNGGKDKLFGNGGKDRLIGGGGKDVLKGGPANDRLKGNGGPDTLRGQGGVDKCNGGPGLDRLFTCE